MRNIDFTLLDDFEFIGKWWLPEFPHDVVAGRISYSAHDSILLELIGSFEQINSDIPEDPEIILGISTKGHEFTLVDNLFLGSPGGYPEFQSQHYESRYLLVGHHFQQKSDLLFSSFAVSYEHLEEWYGKNLFTTERLKGNDSSFGYNVQIARPKPENVQLPSRNGILNISFDIQSDQTRHRSFTINNEAFFIFKPFAPQDFDWFNRLFFDIERFLILVITSVTFPRRIRGSIEIDETNRKWIDVFRFQEKRASKHIYRWDMLFTYPQMAIDFPALLDRWLISIEQSRPAYDLFFSYLYKPDNYLEFKFLALVQALESFHRSIKGKEKAFLKTRLEDLFLGLEPSLKELVSPDYNNFISEIKDTRNYFTHYNEKDKKKSLSYQEMIIACKQMQVLLTILFLKQLELDNQVIFEHVSRNKRLKF